MAAVHSLLTVGDVAGLLRKEGTMREHQRPEIDLLRNNLETILEAQQRQLDDHERRLREQEVRYASWHGYAAGAAGVAAVLWTIIDKLWK